VTGPLGVDPADLADLPLFAGMAPADLSGLAGRLGRMALAPGCTLMSAEQPGEIAYIIQAGTLRVLLADADGSELTLALLGAGEIVGEMALIDDDVRSATVVAIEPVSLFWIDRATFAYYRQYVPRLVDNLTRILAQRLRRTNEQLLALATLDVTGRVARQLLLLAEAYGRLEADGIHIHLRLTQDDLAQLVSATRVRVNQAIGQFKRQGILAVDDQHQFVIRDMDALRAYL